MILIVGLGNPGKKYNNTRHNIGSRVINELESLDLKNVILAKPTTFMNESGKAIKKLFKVRGLKFNGNNLIVIHDDLDLPLEKIRIIKNRGAAGHKGVESIIKAINSKNFFRFRIGICPKNGKPKNREKFVLQKFNKEEEKIIKKTIKKTAAAIELFLKKSPEKAMNEYNK